MKIRSGLLVALAVSTALAPVPRHGDARAQGVSAGPAQSAVLASYSTADQKVMANFPLADVRVTGASNVTAVAPKGAIVRRVRIFLGPDIIGFQLVYESAGQLFETEVAGSASATVRELVLEGADRVSAVTATSNATELRSIAFETESGKKMEAGTADGPNRTRLDLPEEFLGLVGTSTDRILSIGALISARGTMARTYLEQLGKDGQPRYRSDSSLGYAATDKIVRSGAVGIIRGEEKVAMIPKGAEIARIVVYGDQTINGLSLGYRSPGSEQVFPTPILGQATGKRRVMNFAPGETLAYVIARWDSSGIRGLMLEKSTAAQVTYGAFDQPGLDMQGLGPAQGETPGFIGFTATSGAMLNSLAAVRLPQAASQSAASGPQKAALTCSQIAAEATTKSATGSDAKNVILARAKGLVLERQFAAIELDDQQAAAAEQKFGRSVDACRFTLDGLWSTNDPIVLNAALSSLPDNMTLTDGEIVDNGNYTDRQFVVIANSEDPDNQISVMDALGDGSKTFLNSSDGISLAALIRGEVSGRKTFQGGGTSLWVNTAPHSKKVEIRITRGGKTQQFYRPVVRPDDQPVGINDTFVISQTLDNLPAAQRGYDITRDSPFFINNNLGRMWQVFEVPGDLAYELIQKQAVPVGLWYVPDGLSGMISTDTLITTETDYQKSVSNAYGASLGYGKSPNEKEASQGKKPISASIAVDYVKSQTNGMREGSVSSMAMAIARTKKYAVVVNHAYSQLKPTFIDDLYTAVSFNNFDTFIERYGTHYAYATTYGSAARSQEKFDQQATADWASESESLSVKVAGEYKGVNASASYSRSVDESNSSKLETSVRTSALLSTCTGGANASAQQGEKDCPILLDLRPIYDLVSPMYFAGSEEWVYQAKPKLRAAVDAYLLSKASLIDDNVKSELWQVSMKQVRCTNVGTEAYNTASIRGSVTFEVTTPLGADAQNKPRKPIVRTGTGLNKSEGKLDIPCDSKWVDLAGTKPIIIAGTPTQLGATTVTAWINWLVEVDGGTLVDPDDDLVAKDSETLVFRPAFAFKGVPGSELGSSVNHVDSLWDGKSQGDPTLDVQYTFKRIR